MPSLLNRTVTLEKNTRYSDSVVYRIQRKFFADQGVNAFLGHVPYYITSNPTIANMYAQVIIGMAQDYLIQGNYDSSQPIYLVEIGTGPGRFSFYVMKKLMELQKTLKLDVKFKYVMTDFTGSNMDFWLSHPRIKEFVDVGLLDFAIYDAEKSHELRLINENKTLSKGDVNNPMIVFCNYLFDSVPHDAFHINDKGEIHEATLRVTTPSKNLKNKEPVDIKKIDVSFEYHKIDPNTYYDDPALNQVLIGYEKSLKKASTILIPYAGIRCINNLREISNNKLLLLACDKGYSHLFELQGLRDPSVVFHGGCFSMMVNFHAMGEYFNACGGQSVIPGPRRGIKTGVFMTGLPALSDLPHTALAIQTHIETFGPSDFFNMHEHMKKSQEDCELRILGAHMNFCSWDPHIFHFFCKRIGEEITKAEEALRTLFLSGMKKIMDNFYYMPNNQNIPFEVALIYHALKDYRQAIIYYDSSIEHFGLDFSICYNAGLCHYLIDEFEEALKRFTTAYELNPNAEEAKEWIDRIKQEMEFSG